jgi:hypothetical protein
MPLVEVTDEKWSGRGRRVGDRCLGGMVSVKLCFGDI